MICIQLVSFEYKMMLREIGPNGWFYWEQIAKVKVCLIYWKPQRKLMHGSYVFGATNVNLERIQNFAEIHNRDRQ